MHKYVKMKKLLTILGLVTIILTAFTVITYTKVIFIDLQKTKNELIQAKEKMQENNILINTYKRKIIYQNKILLFCQQNIK